MRPFSVGQRILCCLLAASSYAAAQDCSTEKVNNDCTVTVDRSYPVALPTIQLRRGKRVTVTVQNGLPFEVLSLDLQTGQAVAGTDQTAGFLSAALPNLKGLLVTQQLNTGGAFGFLPPPNPNVAPAQVSRTQIDAEQVKLNNYFHLMHLFDVNATVVYNQLNEILTPIPPEVLLQGQRLAASNVGQDVPRPWIAAEYDSWLRWMRCEIAGQECSPELPPPAGIESCTGTDPPVRGLLTCGTALVSALAVCPTQVDDNSSNLVACEVSQLEADLKNLSAADQDVLAAPMRRLKESFAALTVDAAAVANIDKDLGNYFFNIQGAHAVGCCGPLGTITDPQDVRAQRNVQLPRFLGRQVVYSVSAVNQIGTSSASVITPVQKKTILSITVVYADPIFEVSAGSLFSMLPNRSFANQTAVTQTPGSSPTPGNVVITQTISRPTVVLFAGGNWRLGHDFLWPDSRRGAMYFTTSAGLNVNNTAAEFGVGPSVSWRSLMFSVLYDWGHDMRLTQGEYVGQIWCNQSAASSNGSIPKCSGQPPAPSTEKYWRGAIAFGLSVRVPTLFGGGSGGASSGKGN
jgi:hypothetical protein